MKEVADFKQKMQTTAFRLFLNLFLALLTYSNSEAVKFLGIKDLPLAISVVWPVTGFSLTAILLFGKGVWPGIFLGSLFYNLEYFVQPSMEFLSPIYVQSVVAATAVTIGSLTQALVAGSLMQRYSTPGYFNTVKDIFIFLLPVGLLANLIACTVGITVLYLYGALHAQDVLFAWFCFWIGDVMGVYIFTPFLVTWSTRRRTEDFNKYSLEAFFMLVAFIVLSIYAFYYSFPLAHLYLPLIMWIAYRFRMRGATLAVLMTALVIIISISIGVNSSLITIRGEPLIILITFLEVIVATALLLAAVVNEREIAWEMMRFNNIDLQQALQLQKQELKEMGQEMILKEKLTSLSMLTSHMAKLFQYPLKMCRNFMEASLDCVRRLQEKTQKQQEAPESDFPETVQTSAETLERYFLQITKFETQIHEVAQLIKEQTAFSVLGQAKTVQIDVNNLLESCLTYIGKQVDEQIPHFEFSIVRRFDQKVKLTYTQPEELCHAFIYLFRDAISSMKRKKEVLGDSYEPILEIDTKESFNQVHIVVRNNGVGADREKVKFFFQSFLSSEHFDLMNAPEESLGLGLSLAHDIIVHVYRGKISVKSVDGGYLEVDITLPK